MSYILDALRKADAQRASDPARGIHAQPLRAAVGEGGRSGGLRPWVWVAGVAGLVVVAATGWYFLRDGAPAGRSGADMAAAPAVRTPVPPPPAARTLPPPVVVAAAPVVMPPPVVVAPPVKLTQAIAPLPAPPASPVAPVPATAPSQPTATPPGMGPATPRGMMPVPVPGAASPPPAPAPGPAPVAPRAAVPVPVPPAPPTPPAVGLPPEAPKLVITGGIYSANRAQRMLIVNGQVYTEGSDLGQGVTLEEIKPKSAVLRFRGAPYSVSY